MGSSHAIYDSGNGALDHAVFHGEVSLGVSSVIPPDDISNIIVGEFSICHGHDPGIYSMIMVSDAADPFEIGPDVVGFDRVDMVHLGKTIGVWDECPCHQAVDYDVSEDGRVAKIDLRIATTVRLAPHLPSLEVSGPFHAQSNSDHFLVGSIQRTYSASVAHLIEVGELSNRNWTPFLGEYGDHNTNLPCEVLASFNMAYAAIQDGDVGCRLL
jgi:hypothetical protein